MCGIVAATTPIDLHKYATALRHRGPDALNTQIVGSLAFGHTRLAILDLDERSSQPFAYGSTTLSFNGEIWNYKHLRYELFSLGHKFKTTSDTEVLAAVLDTYGPAGLERLEGMFAVAWTTDRVTLHLARDRFGEMPLHVARIDGTYIAVSERKALPAKTPVHDVGPGEHWELAGARKVNRYYLPPIKARPIDRADAAIELRSLVRQASTERAISDVPVCTLLSGGIDSAAVALELNEVIPNLVAYTAVLNPRSRDLRNAREVARSIGIELREIGVECPTADDLSRVVNVIELPYKAQVEIGWPCLKLAEAMRADGFKVTFSGEGSDELWASYGFAYHALAAGADWHEYRRDLFLTQARKNFPRANKAFMSAGIECRLPFLHSPLVEFALSLPINAVQNTKSRPKAVLQEAYQGDLPDEVCSRPKVAFQDGMGLKQAVANTLSDPKRFYTAEWRRRYG